jgi:hypothetical protein
LRVEGLRIVAFINIVMILMMITFIVIILMLMVIVINRECIYVLSYFIFIRPDDHDGSDGEDGAACGQTTIDLSMDEEDVPAPVHSPISSVGYPAAANYPTGDGVFSPFSPEPAGAIITTGATSDSPCSSIGSDMFSVDEEFARLAEMDSSDLEREIQELCGGKDGSPCVSLAAPSEPWSWLESLKTPVYEPAESVERPRDPVAATLHQPEDPRQNQYFQTLLDARGQLPSRKRKSHMCNSCL